MRCLLLPFALLTCFTTLNGAFAQPEPPITFVIRDFGPRGFDYGYGSAWKTGVNVKPNGDGVKIDTNEAGGVGLVLNGQNLAPHGQTHLAVRLKVLDGNTARTLQLNFNGPGANKNVSLDLSKLGAEYRTILIPLPEAKYDKIEQIQLQGTNWGGGQVVKLMIDKIGTTTPDEAANTTTVETAVESTQTAPGAGAPAKASPSVPGLGLLPSIS